MSSNCGCDQRPCVCQFQEQDILEFQRCMVDLNRLLRNIRKNLPTAKYFYRNGILGLATGLVEENTSRYDRIKVDMVLGANLSEWNIYANGVWDVAKCLGSVYAFSKEDAETQARAILGNDMPGVDVCAILASTDTDE